MQTSNTEEKGFYIGKDELEFYRILLALSKAQGRFDTHFLMLLVSSALFLTNINSLIALGAVFVLISILTLVKEAKNLVNLRNRLIAMGLNVSYIGQGFYTTWY